MTKLLIIFLFLISCSSFKKEDWSSDKPKSLELSYYKEFDSGDYADHLESFKDVYLIDKKYKLIGLNKRSNDYLKKIIKEITESNELFFNQVKEATFYIVKSDIPFHFSLPGRKFFFSSSLIEQYIKNETMLYCLMVYELIRSEKGVYEKTIIIPTGTLSTPRMLALLRINTLDKVEIHKWAFYLLKRIGIDTDSYLSWLQIKNRNSLDFSLQLGDLQSISREESLFKSFLIEEVKSMKNVTAYKRSSKTFYTFLNNIKRRI